MFNRKTISFRRLISMLLVASMLVSLCMFEFGTSSSAYEEIDHEANWYSWGTMQSTVDDALLYGAYGNPVSAEFVNGEYVVTADSTPNANYLANMQAIAEWAKTGYATLPDGTAATDLYGTDFWAGYNNTTTYYGFRVPQMLNKGAASLNDIPVWYPGNAYAGNVYYACWTNFRNLALAETSGNIMTSACSKTVVPGGASISFKINTTAGGTGICTDQGGIGKFCVGFVSQEDYANAVNYANLSWTITASCGLATESKGLYVSFASTGLRNSYYDVFKVTNNGVKITQSDLDGWVSSDMPFDATGATEYTIFLSRTGGSSDVNGTGTYSMTITDGTNSKVLATGISLNNSTALKYMITAATPAYCADSPEFASYTVTGLGTCENAKAIPENFAGAADHAWDSGVVTNEATCETDGSKVYTCTNPNCACTKTEALSKETVSHLYGEWAVTVDPDCEYKGVKARTCVHCGAVERANVPATGHAYSDWQTVQVPTCTAPGERQKVCANCGDTITEYTEADGHTFRAWTVTTAPTASSEGEKTRSCSVCGYTEAMPVAMDVTPHIVVYNYTLNVEDTQGLNFIRIAPGVLSTSKEIKNAEGLVSVNQGLVAAGTSDGVYRYDFSTAGAYTLWLRYDGGAEYIRTVYVDRMYPTVTTNGLIPTVHNLNGVSDFFIAKGHYTTYRDVKNAPGSFSVSSSKIGASHDYTYGAALPGVGEYTLWIRYADANREPTVIYFPCVVILPVFKAKGLQLSITNTEGARVVRIAPGEWNTPGEIKRAEGCRNFTAKSVTAENTFVIQNSRSASGTYSVSIEYTNGYSEVFHFTVAQKTPSISQSGTTLTLGNLKDMYLIRYAPGRYTTAADIKAAPGSEYLRPDDVIGYEATFTLLGTYTFLVQYEENSANIFTLTVGEEATGVRVSKAFSNDMIVQRNKPLSVWGWADAGQEGKIVSVSFRGEEAYGVVNANGEWKATFDKTFSESTDKETLTVKAKNFNVNYTGIMTGDVYYVIGQSNVYWSMSDLVRDLNAAGKLSTLQFDFNDSRNIRFFRNSNGYYANMTGIYAPGTSTLYPDVVANVSWMKPSNSDMPNFSAIGYLTAYHLSNCTTTPIGFIEIDASGLELAAFSPNELNDRWGSDIEDTSTGIHYMKLGTGANMTIYPLKSRFAYNQQLYPLINFSCAGVMWYQGESDYMNTITNYGKNVYTFSTEFTELMQYFRSHMGNSDFPVFIMEFPSCYYNNGANSFIATGEVRSELGTIPTMLENSYVLSSSDMWPASEAGVINNIHPYCKPAQALRACFTILAKNNGIGDLNYVCGPQLTNVEYTDANTVVLTFDHVGDGLQITDLNHNGLLYGFEVLTTSTTYKTGWMATGRAAITAPNQITITETIPIYGVRYNAQTEAYFPVSVNVSNSNGIPMIAFADYKN